MIYVIQSKPKTLLENYYTGSNKIYELRIPKDHALMHAKLPPFKDVENLTVECYRLLIIKQVADNNNALVLVKFPNKEGLFGIDIFVQGGADWNPYYKKEAYKVSTPLDRRIVMGFCLNYSSTIHSIATERQSYYDKLRNGKRTGDLMSRWHSLVDIAYNYTYKGIKARYERGPRAVDDTTRYSPDKDLEKAIKDYIKDPSKAKLYRADNYDGIPSYYDFQRDIHKFETVPRTLSGVMNGALRF